MTTDFGAKVAGSILVPAYILLVPWMWSPFPMGINWADLVFGAVLVVFWATRGIKRISFTSLDVLVGIYWMACALSLIHASLTGALALLKITSLVLVYLILGAYWKDQNLCMHSIRWLVRGSVGVVGSSLAVIIAGLMFDLPITAMTMNMLVPGFGKVIRLTAGFPTPELLGNFLTMSFPFILGCIVIQDHREPWAIAGLCAIVLAEGLTYSHSWAGFLVAGLVFTWPLLGKCAWVWIRAGFCLVTVAVFLTINVASVIYVQEASVRFRPIPVFSGSIPDHVAKTAEWPHIEMSATYNYLNYFLLKSFAWETFQEHPVVGAGLGSFPEKTEKAYLEGRLQEVARMSQPHSTFFGHFAESGVLGGMALLGLWIGAFRVGRKIVWMATDAQQIWTARAVLSGFVGVLVNAINVDVMHFRFLWIGLALLRGMALAQAPKSEYAGQAVVSSQGP